MSNHFYWAVGGHKWGELALGIGSSNSLSPISIFFHPDIPFCRLNFKLGVYGLSAHECSLAFRWGCQVGSNVHKRIMNFTVLVFVDHDVDRKRECGYDIFGIRLSHFLCCVDSKCFDAGNKENSIYFSPVASKQCLPSQHGSRETAVQVLLHK